MAAAEIAAYCASSDYAGLSQYCENFELDLRHTEVDLTASVGVYKVHLALTATLTAALTTTLSPATPTATLTATLTTTRHPRSPPSPRPSPPLQGPPRGVPAARRAGQCTLPVEAAAERGQGGPRAAGHVGRGHRHVAAEACGGRRRC